MSGPSYHGRTHTPNGTDPIPGVPTLVGDSIEDIILSKAAVGLWKLNESAGNTAADSSGAGNHMTVPTVGTSYTAPTWGQPAGPPGTQSALFDEGVGVDAGSRLRVTMSSGMTDDFSAGVWVHVTDPTVAGELLGQGTAIHGSSPGWMLFFDVSTNKFGLRVGTPGIDLLESDNAGVIDTWYLFGVSRIAGTWTMYVDGLVQADTSTATPGADTATWIGDCGNSSANHGSRQTMSWAFITDTPLSGSDWGDLNDAATSGGVLASGLVWTSDGIGGVSWQAPTIEVEF